MMSEFGDKRYEQLADGEFPKGLGIQVYRKLMGITQQELAAMLNVTPSSVSSWENGRTSVSPKNMERVSEILGVSTLKLQHPVREDIERASHMALYRGDQMHRMILNVEHEQDAESEWPERWREPAGSMTEEELDRFFAEYERQTRRSSAPKPSAPKPSLPRVKVGYNGLFTCCTDGTKWRLTRRPTLRDVLLSIDEERITLGVMLRCLRLRLDMQAKDIADEVNSVKGYVYINPSSYGNVEYDRGPYCEDFDTDYELLSWIEDFYKLERMTLIGLTTGGRAQLKAMLSNK